MHFSAPVLIPWNFICLHFWKRGVILSLRSEAGRLATVLCLPLMQTGHGALSSTHRHCAQTFFVISSSGFPLDYPPWCRSFLLHTGVSKRLEALSQCLTVSAGRIDLHPSCPLSFCTEETGRRYGSILIFFWNNHICLATGTVYRKHEPIFFQSLGNPFIFRCIDGILIDGNDKGLSRSVYR